MTQIILFLSPLIVLGIVFAGGLGKENPFGQSTPSNKYATLEEGTSSAEKSLQIANVPATVHEATSSTSCTPNTKVAVDLLLDTSGSMGSIDSSGISKIEALKNAVINFSQQLKDDDVIGVQYFYSTAQSLMTPKKYSEYKNTFESTIRQLQSDGSTSMYQGFLTAQQDIESARVNFSDYNWALIFLSDGKPTDQNPSPIAATIKGQGIRIITIGLGREGDYNRPLMELLASSTADFHPSSSAADLQSIYQSIATAICR